MAYNLKDLLSQIPLLIFFYVLIMININKPIKLFKVEERSKPTLLNFTGFANPIDNYSVLSPVDGTVKVVFANYGALVRKGDILFSVQSSKLSQDFRNAMETYLRAKETYQSSLFRFNGNKELYGLGLISKITYIDSENQLKDANLALLGAEENVQKLSLLVGINFQQIKKISLDEVGEFLSLASKTNQGVKIMAQHDGTLLFPSKTLIASAESSSESSGPLKPGALVKEGQIIAVIANMSGLSLQITFSENDFQNISIGQKASVTFPALADFRLEGKVSSINHQANSADATAMPSYNAEVIVPSLTKEEREEIQVGMSVQVTLIKSSAPKITIPLEALEQKDDQYFVTIRNISDKTLEKKRVIPGKTDINSVEIVSGLKSGDEIVLPN